MTSVDRPSITCPRCTRTSYHLTDIREGYCGACHDWTTPSLQPDRAPVPRQRRRI